MTCSFCGREFTEQAAQKACQSCAMFGGCRKLKCPYCGYETPAESRLLGWLKNRKSRPC